MLNITDFISDNKIINIDEKWILNKLSLQEQLTKENIKIINLYVEEIKHRINELFYINQEYAKNKDEETIKKYYETLENNDIETADKENDNIALETITIASITKVLYDLNVSNNVMLSKATEQYRKLINNVKYKVDMELNIKLLPDSLLNEKSKKVQDDLIKELKDKKGINFVVDNDLKIPKITNKSKVYKDIIAEEISKMNEQGITSFVSKSGAEWSPEAYAKLKINSERNNQINQIQEERMKQIGGNYWETSSHTGARPLCFEDQGQIFSINGDTTPIDNGNGKKIKVRAWSSSSYGKPDGILGINCRHSRYIFIPGISYHRKSTISKTENDKEYKERQKQKYYERTIRNKKRNIEELKRINADDNFIKQKENNLKNFSKNYNLFLKETDRKRNYNNEQIIDKSFISKKQKEKLTKQYQNFLKRSENK